MLTEPTPFDLRMHVFRIPVRVHPSFWIIAAALGWHGEEPQLTLIWVLCVFVSILVHELGHALVAEALGWRSEILLYAFGGLAFSDRIAGRTPTRDIFVSIAGPAAQFCMLPFIFLAIWGLGTSELPVHPYVYEALSNLVLINLAWPILNLMPVLPLDGGQIMQSFLELFRVRDSASPALVVSIIVGGLLAYTSYTFLRGMGGILFVILTIMNIQAYQQHRAQRW